MEVFSLGVVKLSNEKKLRFNPFGDDRPIDDAVLVRKLIIDDLVEDVSTSKKDVERVAALLKRSLDNQILTKLDLSDLKDEAYPHLNMLLDAVQTTSGYLDSLKISLDKWDPWMDRIASTKWWSRVEHIQLVFRDHQKLEPALKKISKHLKSVRSLSLSAVAWDFGESPSIFQSLLIDIPLVHLFIRAKKICSNVIVTCSRALVMPEANLIRLNLHNICNQSSLDLICLGVAGARQLTYLDLKIQIADSQHVLRTLNKSLHLNNTLHELRLGFESCDEKMPFEDDLFDEFCAVAFHHPKLIALVMDDVPWRTSGVSFSRLMSGKFRKLKWLGGEDALSAPQTRLLFENLEKASSSLLYLDVDTCRTDSNSSQALTRILGRLPNLCAFKIYNSSVAACQQILEILMRHCRYRQKWAKFSLAICFIRANRHHRFQDSVLALVDTICLLANDDDDDDDMDTDMDSYWEDLSAALGTRFARNIVDFPTSCQKLVVAPTAEKISTKRKFSNLGWEWI